MSPKLFTALTLATAAAAGITALALHAPAKTDCTCEHAEVVPPDVIDSEVHYIKPDYGHHFARPPAPEPMPTPSPAPVA